MRAVVIFALGFLVAGCAAKTETVYINYTMVDQPDNQRVQLRYRNETKTAICLTNDQWPNSAGKINYGSDFLILVVKNERFPVIDFDTGVCSGPCAERVAVGEEVVTYVPYTDFKLPERLWNEPKTLKFRPQGFSCGITGT